MYEITISLKTKRERISNVICIPLMSFQRLGWFHNDQRNKFDPRTAQQSKSSRHLGNMTDSTSLPE